MGRETPERTARTTGQRLAKAVVRRNGSEPNAPLYLMLGGAMVNPSNANADFVEKALADLIDKAVSAPVHP